MRLWTAIQRLWTRPSHGRPPGGSQAQVTPASPAAPAEAATDQPARPPEPFMAAVHEQITQATEEFRRTLDAGTATAVTHYRKLREAAESQRDEHLRSSLLAYADHQFIQSIRWLLDSEAQFTAATTTTATHEHS